MKKVVFTLIFNDVDESHLGKDVFLVPRYWCKIHHAEGNIVYPRKLGYKELPNQHRGINLIPLKTYLKRSRKSYLVSALIYLLCNAWKIDVLMQFHFSDNTLYLGNFFKLLHPNGFLYIKCDGEYWLDNVLEVAQSNHGFRATIKRLLYERLLKKANMVSIETETGYEKLQTKLYFGISLKEKSCLLENGFDEDLLKEQSINELTFIEKENLIITVGRLGAYPKNIELILKAAEGLSFKNWKMVLIGPIEKEFKGKIEDFFSRNANLKNKIVFVGAISDKKELWEWYNRAKVFVFTSKSESFGLVLMEAYRFNNYIISTDVGWAKSAIKKSIGEIIPQDDYLSLRNAIQSVIDKNMDLSKKDIQKEDISYEILINNAFKEWVI